MRKLAPCATVFVLVALLGCGSCESEEETPSIEPAAPATPAVAPEGLLWELSVGGGSAMLGATRDLLPTAELRALLPARPGALVERVAPSLPVADAVSADATVWVVAVRTDLARGQLALAVPVEVPEGQASLGDLPLIPGAPHGARWVGSAPTADATAAVVSGGVLVVTSSPRMLETVLPYMTRTLIPSSTVTGFRLRVPPGVAAGPVRQQAERLLSESLAEWSASAERERAEHVEPPELGDPEGLIEHLRGRLGRWIAYLPDLQEVTAWLRPEPGGFAVTVDASIAADSPLDTLLRAYPARPIFGLDALPAGTAVASSFTRGPDDPGGLDTVDAIMAVGGSRIGERARGDLRRGADALDDARGEGTLVALGTDALGPWALWATRGGGSLDAEALRRALGAEYVRDVAAALLGCPRAIAPAAFSPPQASGASSRRVSTLCTPSGGPPVRLAVSTSTEVAVVSVSRTEEGVDGFVSARLAGAAAGPALVDHPDVQRGLSWIGRDRSLIGVILLVPSRVPEATGLLQQSPGGSPAPLLLGMSARPSGARVEALLPGPPLTDLLAILAPFLE